MANPQPTDSHLRLANTILDEFIMRDFPKTQRKIIDLLIRVSWACGKKQAIIPSYTKYFSLILGIPKQNIKRELENLVLNKVIFWDKNTNVFKFNKNYDEWKIPYNKSVDLNAYKELISKNLKSNQDDYQVINNITQSSNFDYSVIKKRLLNESGNIDTEQEKDIPITNIITNNYNNADESINEQEKKFLTEIQKVENYPLDINKDLNLFRTLEQDFPQLNIVEAVKAWTINKLDNPLAKSSNPRSQLRTWIKKGQEWGQYPKQGIEELSELAKYNQLYAKGGLN